MLGGRGGEMELWGVVVIWENFSSNDVQRSTCNPSVAAAPCLLETFQLLLTGIREFLARQNG